MAIRLYNCMTIAKQLRCKYAINKGKMQKNIYTEGRKRHKGGGIWYPQIFIVLPHHV